MAAFVREMFMRTALASPLLSSRRQPADDSHRPRKVGSAASHAIGFVYLDSNNSIANGRNAVFL